VALFNVSGRGFDFGGDNNTVIHSWVGLGGAEQPLGVNSIVVSDVVRNFSGNNNSVLHSVIYAGRNNNAISFYSGQGHRVEGNRIGITPSGVVLGGTSTTNTRNGVSIDATNVHVIDNLIAGIAQNAITVGEFGLPGGTGHTFTRNSMFLNQGLGVDLGANGVTPNDGAGDPDTGPNNLQNYPVVVEARQAPFGLRIAGNFLSVFEQQFFAEVFASSSTPAINTDEGGRSLGGFNITTDSTGQASFDVTIPAEVKFGEVIVATATDHLGNTSEFSVSVPVSDDLVPTVSDGSFEFEYGQAISFGCSEGAIAGVDPNDLLIESIPQGGVPEILAAFFLEDQNRIRFILRGADRAAFIADGNYRCTFQPNSIQDAAGNLGPPVSRDGGGGGGNPRVIDFFVFAGDANRDRAINIGDFAILAGNFNEDGFYSDGDFNYSGRVEIGDFSILASKFNRTLPPPGPGDAAAGVAAIGLPARRAPAAGAPSTFSSTTIGQLILDEPI
jgi:hypothetical protein